MKYILSTIVLPTVMNELIVAIVHHDALGSLGNLMVFLLIVILLAASLIDKDAKEQEQAPENAQYTKKKKRKINFSLFNKNVFSFNSSVEDTIEKEDTTGE